MKTKKDALEKAHSWRSPIDELCERLGFPLTTGNKSGGIVMAAPGRINSANRDEKKSPEKDGLRNKERER